MARSAIEKFISAYIRNKKISETEEGYEAWLRKNGLDPTARLSEKVGEAYAENEKAASFHSSVAEALAERGLSQSGYARYLKEATEAKKNAGIEKAIQSYIGTDSDNKAEYSRELERREAIRVAEEKKAEEARIMAEKKAEEERLKEKKKAEEERQKAEKKAEEERLKAEKKAEEERLKAEKKAEEESKKKAENAAKEAAKKEKEILEREEKIKKQLEKEAEAGIKSMSTIDYNKAYKYAFEIGLDEASAERIAKKVTEARRNDAISKVTNAIISKRLTMNQAKEYASALGLGEEDAKALGELAFRTNESVGDIVSGGGYLDTLQ